jgi:hypothetical protein
MKTLIIKDLARNQELDRSAMTAVRGGMKPGMASYSLDAVSYTPKYDSSIDATQDLTQVQKVLNATANGSAFLHGIHATNKTEQFGQNNITVL